MLRGHQTQVREDSRYRHAGLRSEGRLDPGGAGEPGARESQQTLANLVGAAKEGLLALSVSVGLEVVHELTQREVEEVVSPKHEQKP